MKMAKNTNPQTAGTGRFGVLTQAIPWLWGIDVLAEVIREFKGKTAEETKIDDIVFMVLKVGLLLFVSPFGLAFIIPAGLSWRLDLGNPIKIGVFAEISLIVFVGYLAWKKLRRDPWVRAWKQTQITFGREPDLKTDELAKKVRDILHTDELALKFVDDAQRKLFAQVQPELMVTQKRRRFRLRLKLQPRHHDRPLKERLPRNIVSDLLPKKKSRRDNEWDFL